MMAGHPDHDAAAPAAPTHHGERSVREIAATVHDPEIPVLSIQDLGILRDARLEEDGTAVVVITPTYSGCPAMDTITSDVREALRAAGHEQVRVDTVLQPAWTTDWMTEEGRAKLREYGIAPPTGRAAVGPIAVGLSVKCPQCDSPNTREMTRFSSTACKALYQCRECLEPFDHFKVH
ncbi:MULTISPECIES: 1,2-phenylacetyl-CoA epoxidase subunit PaaD [Nesterenkonia]